MRSLERAQLHHHAFQDPWRDEALLVHAVAVAMTLSSYSHSLLKDRAVRKFLEPLVAASEREFT